LRLLLGESMPNDSYRTDALLSNHDIAGWAILMVTHYGLTEEKSAYGLDHLKDRNLKSAQQHKTD
jgi:hypothetical protein